MLFLTFFILGATHALAPDHCAAIVSLAVQAKKKRDAYLLGLHFGLAHAFVVMIAVFIGAISGLSVSENFEALAECFSGFILFILGTYSFFHFKHVKEETSSPEHTNQNCRHSVPFLPQITGVVAGFLGISGIRGASLLLPFSLNNSLSEILIAPFAFGTGITSTLFLFTWFFLSSANIAKISHTSMRKYCALLTTIIGIYWVTISTQTVI